MIEVTAVRAGYNGREVLHGVSLSVRQGEMVGLLGPNGAGKTTLLLAITGVLPLTAGTVRLGGVDAAALPPKARARRVAAVPQKAEPAFALTVASLVLMGRYPYLSFLGDYTEADRRAADQAMAATGVEALAERPAKDLSGGEFQRVLIARALAQEADVLLLDEAAANLDIARKVEIHDLLKERNAAGTTVLAALHDLNLAALYCRRLILLKDGAVAAQGPVETVFTRDILSEIYATDIEVFPHPVLGVPQCAYVPGALRRGRPG